MIAVLPFLTNSKCCITITLDKTLSLLMKMSVVLLKTLKLKTQKTLKAFLNLL